MLRACSGFVLLRHLSGLGSLLVCLALALVLVGCGSSVRVKTAQDPQVDLGVYRTFAMLQPNKPIHTDNTDVDPFVLQRLRQLTYLRLKEMGYRPVPKDGADLVVGVLASTDTRYQSYSSPTYGYDPYFARAGWSQEIAAYEEGVVVIDLVDRKKSAVVWRGTGIKTVDDHLSDPELQAVVDSILAQFPRRGGVPADEK